MAFNEIHASLMVNVVTIVFGLLLTGFLLLFGVSNLINPDVTDAQIFPFL